MVSLEKPGVTDSLKRDVESRLLPSQSPTCRSNRPKRERLSTAKPLVLFLAVVLLFLAPIRKGELPGYDDAVYAHIAKGIITSGDWLQVTSNGYPALEHPPGFVWLQAVVFSLLGPTDFAAKLPSALLGVCTILLVYLLVRRLTDDLTALTAMFVLAATPYFIKYAARGMTDVPFAFLFTAAVFSWREARARPAWYAVAALACAYALLLRSTVGLAVPLTLGLIAVLDRRSWPLPAISLAISVLPAAAWHGYMFWLHGDFFLEVHTTFLSRKILGEGDSFLRRLGGPLDYLWMLTKSYWPWLPFLGVGLASVVRDRMSEHRFLLVWVGVVFAACSIGSGRILRYLLPAYPAFSILVAFGLRRVIPEPRLERGLTWLIPLGFVTAAAIAVFPPEKLHAAEIRPIAAKAKALTNPGERIGFFDAGQPRFDETAHIQWYGDRTMWILLSQEELDSALAKRLARVWIVDSDTYERRFAACERAEAAMRSGHLVCVVIRSGASDAAHPPSAKASRGPAATAAPAR